MNKKDDFALVPRAPGALERAAPGAKRILSDMVADALALAKKGPPHSPRPLRIVSVDDEEMRLETVEIIVSAYFKGVTVQSFLDAEEAWQELLRTDPDLLITDDLMGKLTGEETVRRLANRKVAYPIIVINGYGPERDEWVLDCVKRGVDVTLLRAPYDLESLARAVESGLRISRDTTGAVGIAPHAGRTGLPKIVIMHHDDGLLQIMGSTVREWCPDATVATIFDDEQALVRELERGDPDLFLLDPVMPRMRFERTVKLLESRKATYPTVMFVPLPPPDRCVQECASRGLNVRFLPRCLSPTFIRGVLEEAGIETSGVAIEQQRQQEVIIVSDYNEFWGMVAGGLYKLDKESACHVGSYGRYEHGDEAWQVLSRVAPSLLILDSANHVVESKTLLRLLAERRVKYPILVTTSRFAKEQDLRECADPNLSPTFLQTPCLAEQLCRELSKHLGSSDNPSRQVLTTHHEQEGPFWAAAEASRLAQEAGPGARRIVPSMAADARAPVDKDKPDKPSRMGSLRIVILDDEPLACDSLRLMLLFDLPNAEILTFTDVEAALEELAREDPDLFTTDFEHPGKKADELLQILATRRVKYPIFVISAYAEFLVANDFLRGFLDRGLNVALLSKPFLLEDLRQLMSTHLGPEYGRV